MSEERKLELAYDVLTQTRDMIGQIYKSEGKVCVMYEDFTDEEVRDFYYRINDMCGKLADRRIFPWQKED